MDFLFDRLLELPETKELLNLISNDKLPISLTGLTHIHKMVLFAAIIKEKGIKPLIITEDEMTAERIIEDLTSLKVNALFFPAKDYNLRNNLTSSHENERNRINVISKICDGEFDAVVCTAEAAAGVTLPKKAFLDRSFSLTVGGSYNQEELIEKLVSGGYVRTEQVEAIGQFSVRGSILDIFSPGNNLPCRIDFFGDEIDSISYFETDSQRRSENAESVKISPCIEIAPCNSQEIIEKLKNLSKRSKDKVKQRIEEDVNRISADVPVCYDPYHFLIFEKSAYISDYFENGYCFVLETNSVMTRVDSVFKLHREEIKLLAEEGLVAKSFTPLVLKKDLFAESLKSLKVIFADNFAKTTYPLQLEQVLHFNLNEITPFAGNISALACDIRDMNSLVTIVLAGTEHSAKNICDRLNEENIAATLLTEKTKLQNGVYVAEGNLTAGFELPLLKFCVIVHSKATATKKKVNFKPGKAVGSLEELNVGDYVVHSTHGIGKYLGIHQIKTNKIVRDYIKIKYAADGVLYVPVTSLDMVSKYIGAAEDSNVKLNKLGSKEWKNTRSRVKASVKKMAKQLTELYAKRAQIKGFAFSEDCDMQSDFESRFLYEETDDQLRCIGEIKSDMQQAVPMDRLLCGDVGFGKTEVAFRAAFKCILDGKQCAILVPTTILAWQHYNTALERFANLPINIEMISRFRKPKQQEKIRKDLSIGHIDLIIGTHSLISESTAFKDLGLIIVDEEQRFGVAQKEKLKEKYPNVDVLTLSATPIPRTLNMALSGLRDMSSLEEAPLNRQPVQTYVSEYDENLLCEVIRRELKRNGQVYYLHNYTDNIASTAKALQNKLPDASIGIAHGKMSEEELSLVWKQLIEHKIDILVCTTIIETGVDVPNVNTLIIEDADRMGLAQLHQLRGRVGRSHRRAFAYFVYRQGKSLSEISRKRLDAIRQFTEFGSGFRIAMRDLEIRGAGSVLGGEQHGHLEAVGYDMYLKMLSDAIAEEKGETIKEKRDCLMDIKLSSHIPEKYIPSLNQRLYIYRRIADLRTDEDKMDIIDELIDRYGEPPKEILGLIRVSMLRNMASNIGFGEIQEVFDNIKFVPATPIPQALSLTNSPLSKFVRFSADENPTITVKRPSGMTTLDTVEKVLSIIFEAKSQ